MTYAYYDDMSRLFIVLLEVKIVEVGLVLEGVKRGDVNSI